MILTCPECATSYFVDDDRIPTAGRTVKCTSCGNRWKALPEGEAQVEAEAPPPLIPPLIDVPDAAALTLPEDDLEFVAAPTGRARKAKTKSGRGGLIAGVVLIAVLAGAVGGLVAMREQVAGLVPGTAPLFAAVGLPVNTLGLAFEGVAWKPTFAAGRPVMAVTGAIRNTNKTAKVAPTVRVNLRGKARSALVSYDLTLTNAAIPPGGLRYFAWNLPDPPANAEGLEIGFNPGAKVAAPAPPAARPPPAEATPLSPDSPDALPHHE